MAYSETRIVIGGLANVPVLIFIANFIKGKFIVKTKKQQKLYLKKDQLWELIQKKLQLRKRKQKL